MIHSFIGRSRSHASLRSSSRDSLISNSSNSSTSSESSAAVRKRRRRQRKSDSKKSKSSSSKRLKLKAIPSNHPSPSSIEQVPHQEPIPDLDPIEEQHRVARETQRQEEEVKRLDDQRLRKQQALDLLKQKQNTHSKAGGVVFKGVSVCVALEGLKGLY